MIKINRNKCNTILKLAFRTSFETLPSSSIDNKSFPIPISMSSCNSRTSLSTVLNIVDILISSNMLNSSVNKWDSSLFKCFREDTLPFLFNGSTEIEFSSNILELFSNSFFKKLKLNLVQPALSSKQHSQFWIKWKNICYMVTLNFTHKFNCCQTGQPSI